MDSRLIYLIVPLVAIAIAWRVFLLRNLAGRQDVSGGRKWGWAATILLGGTIGRLAYVIFGREKNNSHED